jgi:hypothetical protein
MNVDTIKSEILAGINAKVSNLGVTETQTLNQTQIDAITDAAALKLETVNPTTTYPPTGR